MLGQHTKKAFESAIEHHLTTSGGCEKGDREAFGPGQGIFPQAVLAFIKSCEASYTRRFNIAMHMSRVDTMQSGEGHL